MELEKSENIAAWRARVQQGMVQLMSSLEDRQDDMRQRRQKNGSNRSQKAEIQRPELKDQEEKLEETLPSLKLEIVMDRGRSRKDQSRSLGPERIAEREPRPVKLRVSCSGDKIRERKDLED
ncbi:hypothetical protein RRG08_001026 [Elysia crispata]|uniref:Uncharacterized protein n=1 Tax=Elysia crispata TaxID=231223 RepID=A0AAE1E6Q3_9GAST|nr:hypothetical protein RRG08_001026 [Elysia crispata]